MALCAVMVSCAGDVFVEVSTNETHSLGLGSPLDGDGFPYENFTLVLWNCTSNDTAPPCGEIWDLWNRTFPLMTLTNGTSGPEVTVSGYFTNQNGTCHPGKYFGEVMGSSGTSPNTLGLRGLCQYGNSSERFPWFKFVYYDGNDGNDGDDTHEDGGKYYDGDDGGDGGNGGNGGDGGDGGDDGDDDDDDDDGDDGKCTFTVYNLTAESLTDYSPIHWPANTTMPPELQVRLNQTGGDDVLNVTVPPGLFDEMALANATHQWIGLVVNMTHLCSMV